jgi:hypothetical protein
MYNLIKRFLVFLVPLVALLTLQYIIDPYDLYSWQIIPPIAPNVREHKVENYLNHTSRDFETIVLGSSRSMRLNFGNNAYNFGVDDARSEDIYCILRFVLAHCKIAPKRVIVGIDPEFFHNLHPTNLQLLNESLLEKYLIDDLVDVEGIRDDLLAKLSRSLNNSFVSFYDYFCGITEDEYLNISKGTPLEEMSRLDLHEVHPDFDKVYRARFEKFTHLDLGRIVYFNAFIDLCSANNIEVIGLVTVLHPQLDYILDLQGIYPVRMLDMFEYFDTIEYPLFSCYDFSTPAKFGGDDYDFIDPSHIGDYNAELLVERLLELIEE